MAAPAPGAAPVSAPAREGSPLLSIRGLRTAVSSGGESSDIVRDLSLDLFSNEILCLVGESGCGKSITALSVMRLLPTPPVRVVSGEIIYEGRDLLSLRPGEMRAVRADHISMIFQDPLTSLDPVFTVGGVMTEVIGAHRSLDRAAAEEMAVTALTEVGLPDPAARMRSYPHELSGGMRQRVMIALALVLDPEILIADEPTTALDVTVQAQILDKLTSEQRRRGMSMLLITHDLAVVAAVADRVAVMYAGEIVEQAPVEELFDDPRHPYTQGLLRALPHVSAVRRRLHPIAGVVPPPQLMPEGCRFAPRCPHALDRCWTEPPELAATGGGRALRCFNPQPFVR